MIKKAFKKAREFYLIQRAKGKFKRFQKVIDERKKEIEIIRNEVLLVIDKMVLKYDPIVRSANNGEYTIKAMFESVEVIDHRIGNILSNWREIIESKRNNISVKGFFKPLEDQFNQLKALIIYFRDRVMPEFDRKNVSHRKMEDVYSVLALMESERKVLITKISELFRSVGTKEYEEKADETKAKLEKIDNSIELLIKVFDRFVEGVIPWKKTQVPATKRYVNGLFLQTERLGDALKNIADSLKIRKNAGSALERVNECSNLIDGYLNYLKNNEVIISAGKDVERRIEEIRKSIHELLSDTNDYFRTEFNYETLENFIRSKEDEFTRTTKEEERFADAVKSKA